MNKSEIAKRLAYQYLVISADILDLNEKIRVCKAEGQLKEVELYRSFNSRKRLMRDTINDNRVCLDISDNMWEKAIKELDFTSIW